MRISFNFAVLAFNFKKKVNINTLIRTAEAFGAKEFIIVGVYPELNNKLTGGALEYLSIKFFEKWGDAYKYLKEEKYYLIAVEIHQRAKSTFEIKKYPEPCCFIIGSEKEGIPNNVLESADLIVRIPQYGMVGSLNAAIAGSIIIYDYILKNIRKEYLKPKTRNYKV